MTTSLPVPRGQMYNGGFQGNQPGWSWSDNDKPANPYPGYLGDTLQGPPSRGYRSENFLWNGINKAPLHSFAYEHPKQIVNIVYQSVCRDGDIISHYLAPIYPFDGGELELCKTWWENRDMHPYTHEGPFETFNYVQEKVRFSTKMRGLGWVLDDSLMNTPLYELLVGRYTAGLRNSLQTTLKNEIVGDFLRQDDYFSRYMEYMEKKTPNKSAEMRKRSQLEEIEKVTFIMDKDIASPWMQILRKVDEMVNLFLPEGRSNIEFLDCILFSKSLPVKYQTGETSSFQRAWMFPEKYLEEYWNTYKGLPKEFKFATDPIEWMSLDKRALLPIKPKDDRDGVHDFFINNIQIGEAYIWSIYDAWEVQIWDYPVAAWKTIYRQSRESNLDALRRLNITLEEFWTKDITKYSDEDEKVAELKEKIENLREAMTHQSCKTKYNTVGFPKNVPDRDERIQNSSYIIALRNHIGLTAHTIVCTAGGGQVAMTLVGRQNWDTIHKRPEFITMATVRIRISPIIIEPQAVAVVPNVKIQDYLSGGTALLVDTSRDQADPFPGGFVLSDDDLYCSDDIMLPSEPGYSEADVCMFAIPGYRDLEENTRMEYRDFCHNLTQRMIAVDAGGFHTDPSPLFRGDEFNWIHPMFRDHPVHTNLRAPHPLDDVAKQGRGGNYNTLCWVRQYRYKTLEPDASGMSKERWVVTENSRGPFRHCDPKDISHIFNNDLPLYPKYMSARAVEQRP